MFALVFPAALVDCSAAETWIGFGGCEQEHQEIRIDEFCYVVCVLY
jgi:hypothetical protein